MSGYWCVNASFTACLSTALVKTSLLKFNGISIKCLRNIRAEMRFGDKLFLIKKKIVFNHRIRFN